MLVSTKKQERTVSVGKDSLQLDGRGVRRIEVVLVETEERRLRLRLAFRFDVRVNYFRIDNDIALKKRCTIVRTILYILRYSTIYHSQELQCNCWPFNSGYWVCISCAFASHSASMCA